MSKANRKLSSKEVAEALESLKAKGLVEIVTRPDGEPAYRLTEIGKHLAVSVRRMNSGAPMN